MYSALWPYEIGQKTYRQNSFKTYPAHKKESRKFLKFNRKWLKLSLGHAGDSRNFESPHIDQNNGDKSRISFLSRSPVRITNLSGHYQIWSPFQCL